MATIPTSAGEFRAAMQDFLGEDYDEATGETNFQYILRSIIETGSIRGFKLLLEAAYGLPSQRHEIEGGITHTMVTEWVSDYHPGEVTKTTDELEVDDDDIVDGEWRVVEEDE